MFGRASPGMVRMWASPRVTRLMRVVRVRAAGSCDHARHVAAARLAYSALMEGRSRTRNVNTPRVVPNGTQRQLMAATITLKVHARWRRRQTPEAIVSRPMPHPIKIAMLPKTTKNHPNSRGGAWLPGGPLKAEG